MCWQPSEAKQKVDGTYEQWSSSTGSGESRSSLLPAHFLDSRTKISSLTSIQLVSMLGAEILAKKTIKSVGDFYNRTLFISLLLSYILMTSHRLLDSTDKGWSTANLVAFYFAEIHLLEIRHFFLIVMCKFKMKRCWSHPQLLNVTVNRSKCFTHQRMLFANNRGSRDFTLFMVQVNLNLGRKKRSTFYLF